MHGHVLVALLKAVVFSDVVEVVSADDNSPLHLHLSHHTWGEGTDRRSAPQEGGLWAAQSMLGVGSSQGQIPSPAADIRCAKWVSQQCPWRASEDHREKTLSASAPWNQESPNSFLTQESEHPQPIIPRTQKCEPKPQRPSLTRQNPPSDGDITSEGAFLVNVGALNGLNKGEKGVSLEQAVPEITVVGGRPQEHELHFPPAPGPATPMWAR